jgi:cell division protein FtsB
MRLYGTREIDNRDSEQVYEYMEARIEALKQRIHELEAEKETPHANRRRTSRLIH